MRNQKCLLLAIFLITAAVSSSAAATMTLDVDARDLPRGLLKASSTYHVSGPVFDLYYPKWVEGVHGPKSPIQNLAEIFFSTEDGKRLSWTRDPHDVFHFLIDIPNGVIRIQADTTYICNQAAPAYSLGVDTHGTSQLGIIAWNTCLLYPKGYDISDINVNLTLQLPKEWKWGSSLTAQKEDEGTIQFNPVSIRELVDSPLVCGKWYRFIDVTPDGGTPHFLHLLAESKPRLHPDEKTLDKIRKMVAEAMVMFGKRHDYDYHFLLMLSDNLPFIGLEHMRSSLNVVGANGLEEDQLRVTGHLITHEYGHRWCGKYHRPQGMATPDYQVPKDLRLLWVYEGLDQYIGVVLTTRSGLFETKDRTSFEGGLRDEWVGVGKTIVSLMLQKGRRSINLEDTASSSYLRRRGSEHWRRLYRPQDYYFEGALLWYEIDTILQEESDSKLCLDDFIQRFLGRYDKNQMLMGYEEKDIVEILNELLPYDWEALIEDRVRGWHDELPLTVLDRLGYRIEYSPKPTDYDKDHSLTSLGMRVSTTGEITEISPGGPADQAGLYDSVKIIGVNGKKFSENRLKDAIADSPTTRSVELLLLKDEVFETVTIQYDGGPRYVDIVRNEDKPDRFAEIFAPRVK